MSDETTAPTAAADDPKTRRPPRRRARELTPEETTRILELHGQAAGTREIAKRLGLGRRLVRRVLDAVAPKAEETAASPEAAATEAASKLDPYREAIAERVAKDLTTTRILREIGDLGYSGGRSILGAYVRTLRAASGAQAPQRAWRRFETPPAEELQLDWSPYSVPLGGRITRVLAFGATLCWSRKLHVRFYKDERQATLLTALDVALHDFGGAARRWVVDGMSTAVLSRVGADGQPVWHPKFAAFAEAHGSTPFLCRPGDPDRKGKDERAFWYVEQDFVRGGAWESLEDMNAAVRRWLDQVANVRVHRTTGRVPDEAWREERPLLIPLPAARPAFYDEETREVGDDTVASIRGTAYTLPPQLAGKTVVVRLHAERFEVIDPRTGEVAFGRAYVPDAEKGRLVIDPAHAAAIPPRKRAGRPRTDAALLRRFPTLAPLVDGLRLRFKGLAHVHLARLSRLAERYGDAAFLAAATCVQELRRADALDVERVLERDCPVPPQHEPIPPVGAAARALVALGDVDPGSLDDYAGLDRAPSAPSEGDGPTQAGTEEVGHGS